jgi:hypothetical protein
VGTKPEVLVPPGHCVCLEVLMVQASNAAVDAIASDNQIDVSDLGKILDLALELDIDTEFDCSINENVEKMLAADGVSVSTEVCPLLPDVYFLVVP